MAASPPAERIRLEDILLPTASGSVPLRRKSQVARKSTGGMPPRTVTEREFSPKSASPSVARESTEDLPAKPTMSPSPMTESGLEPPNMPTRNNQRSGGVPFYRKSTDGTPGSDGTGHSRAGSSDPSSSSKSRGRATQTARKTTGGAPPRRQLDESVESTPSSHNTSLPSMSLEGPASLIPCGLCPVPLLAPYNADPSQPLHHFITSCLHQFHYLCYINYITTAPPQVRTRCPQCQASLLSRGRYWVNATTHTGIEGQTDLTENIEERLAAFRQARQQVFINLLASRYLQGAEILLTGPEPIDVNCPTPDGGFTPLHISAMIDNVPAIDFLLSHGADKDFKNEAGLLPIDCARSHNAWNAVTRLT